MLVGGVFFFFKQKTAYEMRISDWSSDVCSSDLVPFGVIDADRRRLLHPRRADRGVFELDRADPFAARLDHILRAVGDLHHAVGVQHRDVAGVESALTVRGLGIGLKITLDDPRTAALKPSARLAVAWQHIALIVDDAQLEIGRA